MRLEKKKGVIKFRIVEHNKKLLYVILFLIIVLGFVIYGITQIKEPPKVLNQSSSNNSSFQCNSDFDCVPASCCHATTCVNKNQAPNCSRVACTMECRGNTLDCGEGSCSCINNKCSVKWNK